MKEKTIKINMIKTLGLSSKMIQQTLRVHRTHQIKQQNRITTRNTKQNTKQQVKTFQKNSNKPPITIHQKVFTQHQQIHHIKNNSQHKNKNLNNNHTVKRVKMILNH